LAAEVFHGVQPVAAGMSEYNALLAVVHGALNRVATATLVRVVAIDLEAMTVDLNPLVAQLDGLGNATPHGTIHGCPFLRLQGGRNAVIIDPAVGDIGIAVFASHDITAVMAAKGPANPGSRRRFSMADAMYLGGLLNATPERFVRITDEGVEVTSPAGVTITAPTVTIVGDLDVQGEITASGDVVGDGVSLSGHTHGGVETGGGNTGAPN
jgi:hypothetical protein